LDISGGINPKEVRVLYVATIVLVVATIVMETGMILLIACGVVLVVSIIGARMYILFKNNGGSIESV